MTAPLPPATGPQLADQLTAALASPDADAAATVNLPLILRAHAAATGRGLDQVRRFLASCPATAIGSGQPSGGPPVLYLSAPADAWAGYLPVLRRRPARSPLSGLDVHAAADKLKPAQSDEHPAAWQVTLHPSVAPNGMPCAADQGALDAFTAALTHVGAHASRQPMTSGTLTHIPIRLPEHSTAAAAVAAMAAIAAFPAVRHVSPVARISFR